MTTSSVTEKTILEQLRALEWRARCNDVVEKLNSLQSDIAELTADDLSVRPRMRMLIAIECDREQVPGWGYEPQDMADAAARHAMALLASYSPKVLAASWSPVE